MSKIFERDLNLAAYALFTKVKDIEAHYRMK